MQLLMPIAVVLSWLALPVGLLCVADDWFARPRRQIAAAPQEARDPMKVAFLYHVLPILIAAAVLRLLVSEHLDFSDVLVAVTAVTGLVWALDTLILSRRRAAAAINAGQDVNVVDEPGTVDYARTFFGVALVILVLRSFVVEAFHTSSDDMMPTLVDGDFILVNKYAYGLRLPITNQKLLSLGSPQRGDVVAFRYPLDPSVTLVKRVVALPGDHVEIQADRITVNGAALQFKIVSDYSDGCYENFQLAEETIGKHTHQSLLCPVPLDPTAHTPSGCNRRDIRGYVCGAGQVAAKSGLDQAPTWRRVVPSGSYLVIGDSRDNSEDSRVFGFVPEADLVGKATRVWFNWALNRRGGPNWNRIGTAID